MKVKSGDPLMVVLGKSFQAEGGNMESPCWQSVFPTLLETGMLYNNGIYLQHTILKTKETRLANTTTTAPSNMDGVREASLSQRRNRWLGKAGSDWQHTTGHSFLSDSAHLKGCAEMLMITKQATKGGFRSAMGQESVSSPQFRIDIPLTWITLRGL